MTGGRLDLVTVELSSLEAGYFKDYMRLHDMVTVLLANGVFDIHDGSATLHFDSGGKLGKIEKRIVIHTAT